MLHRGARLVFRVAGWLLTPLVLITFSAIGAAIGLLVAPRLPPGAGLVLTIVFAFASAVTGLVLWARLLRRSPELRETFAVTAEGIPDSPLIDALVHPDQHPADDQR